MAAASPAKRKPGRAPRHPVDVLRTKLWFSAVLQISGLPSAYAVELHLDPGRDPLVDKPRKWEEYRNGERVPTRMVGKVYAVDSAEEAFRGTAKYFESPLWKALKGEALSIGEVDAQLERLGSAITVILFELRRAERGTFFQLKNFGLSEARVLARLGTFEALVAAVLLMLKGQLIASPDLRDMALRAYVDMQDALMSSPDVRDHADELFSFIDSTFRHWVYPSNQSRVEAVIFSRDIRDAMSAEGESRSTAPSSRQDDAGAEEGGDA
jgi:hypothetical protein